MVASRHNHDGRTHLLGPSAGRSSLRCRMLPPRAALYFGFGAVARRHVRSIFHPDGQEDSPALQHVGNEHAVFQSLPRAGRAASGGYSWPCLARRRHSHRRRCGCRAGKRRDRSYPDARAERVFRLLADAGENGRGVHGGRVVSHRGCRALRLIRRQRAYGLSQHSRTQQGFDHHWRLQRLPQLANDKVPKRIEVVDELPRNTMGKM